MLLIFLDKLKRLNEHPMKNPILTLIILIFNSNPVFSSDWGCQVLLCLSNPKGPEAVSECVPPIERLWEALWNGDGMPSCDTNGNGDDSDDENSDNAAIPKITVQKHYNDDDDLKWIKVRVDGKLVKKIKP